MDQKNTTALWRTDEIGDFYGPGEAGLGTAPGRDYHARVKNAAFIVRACNTHEQLVSALSEARTLLTLTGFEPDTADYGNGRVDDIVARLDAALAAAGAA